VGIVRKEIQPFAFHLAIALTSKPTNLDIQINPRVAAGQIAYPASRAVVLSPFGVLAPGIFAVMAPLETLNSRVRTGIKIA
jgi:hypothetical protein